MARYIINCTKCGKAVGRDGFIDYDENTRELGYSLCRYCLESELKKDIENDKKENNTAQQILLPSLQKSGMVR